MHGVGAVHWVRACREPGISLVHRRQLRAQALRLRALRRRAARRTSSSSSSSSTRPRLVGLGARAAQLHLQPLHLLLPAATTRVRSAAALAARAARAARGGVGGRRIAR